MGKPQRRRGGTAKNKEKHRLQKNKHYRRDLDLIYEDMQEKNKAKAMNKDKDELLPGLGQHYCTPCARHCPNKEALALHNRSKPHKRRVKLLAEEKPYDHKEAERLNF
jgi:bud site selection protein 20